MKKMFLGILAALVLAGCNPKEKKQTENATTEEQPQVEAFGEGSEAPDFTLKDPEGKDITLSSFHGQYLVLDFWGTWCKWCVKGIPDMKKYYEKYEGMFEMLSIDVGDSEETWLKAIESYGMNWKHAITDEESEQQLEELYGIEGFPTKIVIDPEGRILNITVGEDPAFYKYLDDLFSK